MSRDKTTTHRHPPAHGKHCQRVRLAESSVAAVDLCACDMVEVHLGPFTVRFAPCALSELLGTLGQAVAEHAAQRARDSTHLLFGTGDRHEA